MAEKPPSGLPMIEGAPPGAFEEVRRGDTQNARRFQQSAGADSIGALLVLLDLLKGYAEVFAQLLLADAEHHPPKPDAAADVNVDWMGAGLSHSSASSSVSVIGLFPPR